MSESNTALARTEAADIPEAGKQEIAAIRQAGAYAVERQRAINNTTRQLAGMTWGAGYGAVKGADLSGATRYAIAQLCELTGANPALHLYILGGRPYLNADYWAERTAGQARFVRFEQNNLSTEHIEEVRRIADQAAADGDEEEAVKLRRRSRYLAMQRSHYSPPEWAVEVYETVIYRYHESAPLAAIIAGSVDGKPWIEQVSECNWAGGKPKGKTREGKEFDADPVGNAEPSKTARSRSFRRCAIKAFQSTLGPIESELRKLENAIDAEFTVIQEDRAEERAALPAPDGPQAVRIGAGEPEAARAVDAEPLPVQQAKATPASARAEKKKFEEGCKVLGVDDAAGFVGDVLGHEATSLEDYQALNAALARMADGTGQDEAQEGLGL